MRGEQAADGFRLFYTGVGPEKPFVACQGYILSATSGDGLRFQTEPEIRVVPRPELDYMSLRVLAPSVVRRKEGGWRMCFETRGPADHRPVTCSAVSLDMLLWELEEGKRVRDAGMPRSDLFMHVRVWTGRAGERRTSFAGRQERTFKRYHEFCNSNRAVSCSPGPERTILLVFPTPK